MTLSAHTHPLLAGCLCPKGHVLRAPPLDRLIPPHLHAHWGQCRVASEPLIVPGFILSERLRRGEGIYWRPQSLSGRARMGVEVKMPSQPTRPHLNVYKCMHTCTDVNMQRQSHVHMQSTSKRMFSDGNAHTHVYMYVCIQMYPGTGKTELNYEPENLTGH